MACLLTGWLDAIAHVFCISVRHNLLSFTHSSEKDGKFVSNERSRSSRLFFFRACLHANPRVIVHSTQLQYGTVHTSSHTSKSIQIKMDSFMSNPKRISVIPRDGMHFLDLSSFVTEGSLRKIKFFF